MVTMTARASRPHGSYLWGRRPRCSHPCGSPFGAAGVVGGDNDGKMLLPPWFSLRGRRRLALSTATMTTTARGDGRRRRRWRDASVPVALPFWAAGVVDGDDDGKMPLPPWLSLRGRRQLALSTAPMMTKSRGDGRRRRRWRYAPLHEALPLGPGDGHRQWQRQRQEPPAPPALPMGPRSTVTVDGEVCCAWHSIPVIDCWSRTTRVGRPLSPCLDREAQSFPCSLTK